MTILSLLIWYAVGLVLMIKADAVFKERCVKLFPLLYADGTPDSRTTADWAMIVLCAACGPICVAMIAISYSTTKR